jgi:hypothetical protein
MEEQKLWHLDPNTITSADCEGAGEMFIVTTFGEQGKKSIPTILEFAEGKFAPDATEAEIEDFKKWMGNAWCTPSFTKFTNKGKVIWYVTSPYVSICVP